MLYQSQILAILEKLERGKAGVLIVGFCSLVWLVGVVPFLSLHNDGIEPFFSPQNKGNQDLANYYMAGSIILEGDFDSLYPSPKENIQHNVGWPDCSVVKPGYAKLAKRRGVEDSFRFILPPPSAFLFVPLAKAPYDIARWLWVAFLGLSMWLCCAISYSIARNCGSGRIVALFWWMTWAFSPLALKAMRTANSTPILAMAMAIAAVGVYRSRTILAIVGCVVAGLLKGTSIIFAPLLIFLKRYAIVGWGGVVVVMINALVLFLAGSAVYKEFFVSVYPSTQLVDPYVDNQSVFGFLYRVFGEIARQSSMVVCVKLFGWALLTVFYSILWKRRSDIAGNYARFIAAVAGLTALYLIFRPYNWGHYALCFVPFTASLWASLKHAAWKAALVISLILLWMPWVGLRGGTLLSAEPLTSHMLVGEIILVAVAIHVVVAKPVFQKALA